MLFNSYGFILLYLPLVFAGTFVLGNYGNRLAALWLGLASLASYAVWDVRYVLLLVTSITFNFQIGCWIAGRRQRNETQAKHGLIAAITLNLTLLAYFKYTNFFIATANQLLAGHLPMLSIILPLGISFFTFTQVAFLVDVHRGIAREYDFVHYLLFVSYFPHLIAGPVLHHKQMMPQFSNPTTFKLNAQNIAVGLTIFVIGLSKKVTFADTLAGYATPIFSAARDGQALYFVESWIGTLAYTLQLYFDFSGYSDMAIGLSMMFNVRLPLNFDSPYKAVSIIEFWRRWHITLSNFLRDYLYIPLGGNRKGTARRYFNLMLTMVLGGLWHGASWTFVMWGGLHGFYLLINHAWRGFKTRYGWNTGEGGLFVRSLSILLTFTAVAVAWVFFRADNFSAAWSMLSGMTGYNGISLPHSLESQMSTAVRSLPLNVVFEGLLSTNQPGVSGAILWIAAGMALVWFFPNSWQMLAHYRPTLDDARPAQSGAPLPAWWRFTRITGSLSTVHAAVYGALFFVLLFLIGVHKRSEFLYYQF